MSAGDAREIRFSCVVDDQPKFRLQAANLVWSLTTLAGVRPERIVVHYIGEPPEAYAELMAGRHGVDLRRVAAAPHPYCNKVQQLATFAGCRDRIVLLDCDTIVTQAVPWPADAPVAAKRVDTATPPAAIWRQLLAHAGLTSSWAASDCLPGREGRETARHNYNGGVYVIDGALVTAIETAWRRWIDFCLERRDLLDEDWAHVDQIAFGLAMTELELDVHALDRRFNFPTHLPLPPEMDCDPYVLHYHWRIDDQQLLQPVGLPQVDGRIAAVNGALRASRATHFDNATFWDYRYTTDPERGSGIGSRGASLDAKRTVVERLLDAGGHATVLDVGCGDLEMPRHLRGPFAYTGVDVSVEALSLARTKRPDWRFLPLPALASAAPGPFDLVLCFDVAIHQPTREDYDRLIALLAARTGHTLLVAGYDEAPAFVSSLTYFHEPLRASLARTGAFAEILTVGRYRDVSILAATRPGMAHPRDMPGEAVERVAGWTRDPLRFRELLDRSRRSLGFFPAHSPRAIEYTWIANAIAARPEAPKVIVDAGAGVTGLPLHLAAAGHRVVTVDAGPPRSLADRAVWNEWGFLDYAQIDPAIRSHNVAFEDIRLDGPADVVYSVSAIEHLPSLVRRRWLRRIGELLRPGGCALLTVDLVPPGDELWPFAAGQLVEAEHGVLGDVLDELRAVGLVPEAPARIRALPDTRVDIALIEAHKPPS